ncbi:hypothetical protein [Endozoicomonas sp. 8E]|uniref:hypothetical protein n=1 Tax=Endozoicomonas sp. 8E TaxID=3035692 RepID=UPI002938EF44|nr:hypothetical protein [Endozoicomonas sp. 8E]WOG26260.1 hypothetical protein P6910_17040 [Endozoicomonas sp. 8E]
MKHISKDRRIEKLVMDLLKLGWIYQGGKKHGKVISPAGKKLAVPGTPSDVRAYFNFRSRIRGLS